MIVLDASAAVDFLLERGERGTWVRDRIAPEDHVVAPHLIDVEVAAAIRRLEQVADIGRARADTAVRDFATMPVTRYGVTRLLERVWQLRGALTPYDAAYIALAEVVAAPVVTTDGRLGRSAGHRAVVEAYDAA